MFSFTLKVQLWHTKTGGDTGGTRTTEDAWIVIRAKSISSGSGVSFKKRRITTSNVQPFQHGSQQHTEVAGNYDPNFCIVFVNLH